MVYYLIVGKKDIEELFQILEKNEEVFTYQVVEKIN